MRANTKWVGGWVHGWLVNRADWQPAPNAEPLRPPQARPRAGRTCCSAADCAAMVEGVPRARTGLPNPMEEAATRSDTCRWLVDGRAGREGGGERSTAPAQRLARGPPAASGCTCRLRRAPATHPFLPPAKARHERLPLPPRARACRSRSTNAPPHRNRMLVVSMEMNSERGFLLRWAGGWGGGRGEGASVRGRVHEGARGSPSIAPAAPLRSKSSAAEARRGAAHPRPARPTSSPPALFGDVDDRALEHAQHGLLHALAADVARDADVLAALRDLVYLRSVMVGGREREREGVLGLVSSSAVPAV